MNRPEHHGSCLCKAIRYTVTKFISGAIHCHCKTCQKAHSSAFSSVALAKVEAFQFTGENSLNSYRSSTNKTRYFCKECGSQIYAKYDNSNLIIVRLGTLDTSGLKEEKHIWTSQKVDWFSFTSELPFYETLNL
tara:strand:+ start:7528 stop:7929 length:402 start_codon:yes stop_codon:yes gene_type:complete